MLQKKHPETFDMFKSRLDQIINLNHPIAKLANQIDWSFFEKAFVDHYSDDQGRPSKTIRLMAGLHYLKHTFDESDESVVVKLEESSSVKVIHVLVKVPLSAKAAMPMPSNTKEPDV